MRMSRPVRIRPHALAWAVLCSAPLLVSPVAADSQQRAGSPPPAAPAPNGTVTAKVVEAANAFLATLSAAERAKCTFSFNSTQRTGWSNLPTGIFQRNGLRFGDMTPRQRQAALALVAAALSREGYQKVTDIMNGDEVLKNAGGGRTGGTGREPRDPAEAFGSDSMNTTWRSSEPRRRPSRG